METYRTENSDKMQTPNATQTQHAEVILLAEDDREMRRLLEQRFRRDGYEVELCADGFELLQHIDSFSEEHLPWKFDLIVSDIRMPGFTGMEILEYVDTIMEFPPMILITAFGDDETRAKAEQLNAAAILDKPFDLDELAGVVRRILDAPESLSTRRQRPTRHINSTDRFPLDIIFHRYPRLKDFELHVKEASRALMAFQSDILSCRIVIAGSGSIHDTRNLEIRGIVVVPGRVFVVSSGRIPFEQTTNFMTEVDVLFAVLKGRMHNYYGNYPPSRFSDSHTKDN